MVCSLTFASRPRRSARMMDRWILSCLTVGCLPTRVLHPAEPENLARSDASLDPAGRGSSKLSQEQPVEEAPGSVPDQADIKLLPDEQQYLQPSSTPNADAFSTRPYRSSQQLPTASAQVGHLLLLSVAGREVAQEFVPRLQCILGLSLRSQIVL